MLSLSQKLSQQQKLSPQQIQYQKLLQLNTLALEQRIKNELEINPVLDIVTICTSGKRSALAVKKLQDNGLNKVWSLEGGLNAWRKFKEEDQYA